MAALAYIVLELGGEATRVDYGVVWSFGGVDYDAGLLICYVKAAGAVATLAVDAGLEADIFILTIVDELREAIVAGHALAFYDTGEAIVAALFETWGEVPLAFLGIEGDGSLEERAVDAENVRVGMLA
jgi:hypothetical protein